MWWLASCVAALALPVLVKAQPGSPISNGLFYEGYIGTGISSGSHSQHASPYSTEEDILSLQAHRSIQQLNGHESSKTLKQDEQTQLDENVVEDTGVANEDVKKRKEVSVFIGVMVRLTPGLDPDMVIWGEQRQNEEPAMVCMQSDVSGTPEEVLDALDRRESARRSWLPALDSYPDIEVRFVVGVPHIDTPEDTDVDFTEPVQNLMQLLKDEQDNYGHQFVQVDVQNCDMCGAQKYLAFLSSVTEDYEAMYYLRIADTTLIAPKHLALAAQQWTDINAAYAGCMANKPQRWNPAHTRTVKLPQNGDRDLIGKEYPAFALMDAYALAGSVAEAALVPNQYNLRQLEHEDTTVGLWMLGLKVNFFNDTRLCASPCNTAQQQDSGNRDLKQQDDDAPVVPQLKHGPVPHNPHAFVCTVGKLLEKD